MCRALLLLDGCLVLAGRASAVARLARKLVADELRRQAQVLAHDVGRARIAPLDRFEEPLVIAHVVRPRIGRVVAQQHARLGGERLVRARETRAAGETHELLVEADVRRDQVLGHVVSLGRRRRSARAPAAGQVGRPRGLDHPPRDSRLDCLPCHVDVETIRERHHPHERAAVQLVLDQAFLLELPDRLAHGAAPGSEGLGERDLAERLALRDAPVDDRLAQLVEDLLGGGGPVDGTELPGVGGRLHSEPELQVVDNKTTGTIVNAKQTDTTLGACRERRRLHHLCRHRGRRDGGQERAGAGAPRQIADAAIEAGRGGAAVVHIHVRDPATGKGARDPALYREVVERIRSSDVDVVLNLSAGMGGDLVLGGEEAPLPLDPDGTDMAGAAERLAHVEELMPEICTLDCGSMNSRPAATTCSSTRLGFCGRWRAGSRRSAFAPSWRSSTAATSSWSRS